MGLIYKLTCPQGKSYIGQTVQTLQKRINNHTHGKSYCRALKDAINVNGICNFKKEIIWEGENTLLSEKEKYYINHFNTMYPNGYNLSSGGGRGESRSSNTIELMTKIQRDITKRRNNGLLGYIVENKSKIDGRVTSWTFRNNKQGSLGNFKNKEDALKFQIDYTQNPDMYINSYVKKRVSNGKGGVYYRKQINKWVVSLYINGKNRYFGSYDTKEKATNVLKIYKIPPPGIEPGI